MDIEQGPATDTTESVPDWVLFLDDERSPPRSSDVFGKELVVARNIREFIAAIEARGEPFMVMMDWYLGAGEPSGFDAARWLIGYDREHDILKQGFMYDSQSSDREKARDIIRSLADHLAEKFGIDPDDARRAGHKRIRPTSDIKPVPLHLRFQRRYGG